MLKSFVKNRVINPISISAVRDIAQSNPELKNIWDKSFESFPDFKQHFTIPVDNDEVENRIRLLVVAETYFIRKVIEDILQTGGGCSYADVGDSDGSVRILLKDCFNDEALTTVGINLQQAAVEKMKSKGLDAICADALSLGNEGTNYDVVSVFETLEHLPDPIGFLSGVKAVTDKRLIISVPYIRRSRVGLAYIADRWPKKWPQNKKSTIENTHIFELCPRDWEKIFMHSGWKIDRAWKMMMYPSCKLSRLVLQPYWRWLSFEGFWFVSLLKDDEYSSRYVVE